ncbi:uncharacterized protein PV06_11293 [Exophiala oligosperma]|uniref:Uncharacterized protein n=1 Tax=Exophiala oligosperma TaxID=215243 RepID=A0A0D2CZP8_9EURO|nr:uncharacterized protein PV06_11293 [Exophiala oligosperma]KIW36478.1 hypothetical protein PV06_11293 [Exophiala oligosperma]
MATVEALALGREATGSTLQFSSATEGTATQIGTTPTTPMRSDACDAHTPQTQRRSLRPGKPTERAREIDEGAVNDIDIDSENTEHGPQTKGRRGRPPKPPQAQAQTETPALTMAQVIELVQNMAMIYETKMKDHLKAYESKMEASLEIGQKNMERIVALETQNQRMMELIKNIANEEVKMTQSWAQVVANAPAANSSSATTPASRPSLPRSSVNPSSSASQPSNLSQLAIIIDLSQTSERARDFPQLKEKVNEALKKHEATREVTCTGVAAACGRRIPRQALLRVGGDGEDGTTARPVARRGSIRPGPHARGTMVPSQG